MEKKYKTPKSQNAQKVKIPKLQNAIIHHHLLKASEKSALSTNSF
jgi:hypothetical protein